MTDDHTTQQLRSRYRACLLGGAIGCALGAAVEFDSLSGIRNRFGPEGIQHYVNAYGGLGRITDDTQMTLFTAEGLLRARGRNHRTTGRGLDCRRSTGHRGLCGAGE